ncbi:MAG: hypothetical protein COZ70_03425 [Deltaproteobacteria bacterium CG_4_8_14_3_um_filter_51_11]|nr:MAG: hypothetical protein AUK25_06425 [Desulfobacteraceae bacterium CG2_30_51_40]PIP45178.1 MAG: hypothetical protein COX16_14660 [Deltaproteobacteria bacterium CG23_combo_of_CG06-09_8_20_14_all_51_20]PIW00767.1 MAG: hypothetical protein COW41_04590 [Deltaproteobacteria bacterium CG17_big_fil_post_rev_8_21_14_2_50_51_6]PIX20472.1 MAG: hypothetical protein COZ70_03425 [Deltaproteobacteria bacterium CG_4_8_14_3_um_filter_51_11]
MDILKKNMQYAVLAICEFDSKIEDIHREFLRYRAGDIQIMPDWKTLERDLIDFSRRKFFSAALNSQLDRILHKFQNRKKIWLTWVDELHGTR